VPGTSLPGKREGERERERERESVHKHTQGSNDPEYVDKHTQVHMVKKTTRVHIHAKMKTTRAHFTTANQNNASDATR